MAQFDFKFSPVIGAGQIADNSDKTIDSYAAAEIISFGVLLKVTGDRSKQVGNLGTDISKFIGISVYNPMKSTRHEYWGIDGPDKVATANQYTLGDTVSVLRRGRIWVVVKEAVTAGNDAFIHYDVTAGTVELCDMTKAIDGGDSSLRIGKFLTSGAANSLVVLDLGGQTHGVKTYPQGGVIQ